MTEKYDIGSDMVRFCLLMDVDWVNSPPNKACLFVFKWWELVADDNALAPRLDWWLLQCGHLFKEYWPEEYDVFVTDARQDLLKNPQEWIIPPPNQTGAFKLWVRIMGFTLCGRLVPDGRGGMMEAPTETNL